MCELMPACRCVCMQKGNICDAQWGSGAQRVHDEVDRTEHLSFNNAAPRM